MRSLGWNDRQAKEREFDDRCSNSSRSSQVGDRTGETRLSSRGLGAIKNRNLKGSPACPTARRLNGDCGGAAGELGRNGG